MVAIGLGKEIFGGLGYNIFNPALVGRAFLVAAFPASLASWTAPAAIEAATAATTRATPLGLMKFEGVTTNLMDLFIGNVPGSLGETSALALIIGGIYLFARKYADWRIPFSYILTVSIFGGIMRALDPSMPTVLFQILSGGLLIGAIFMATDPVTSPVTKLGRWIFGIGCGLFTIIIRMWSGLPEGVMYAILLMNCLTPIINKLTRPRRFGT